MKSRAGRGFSVFIGRLFSAFAVKGFVHLSQMFVCHMRVYLRRRNIGMSQKRLYRAQVRTIFQKISGKGMTNDVWRYFF